MTLPSSRRASRLFWRLDELGLALGGQLVTDELVVLASRVVDVDGWCNRCGSEGGREAR